MGDDELCLLMHHVIKCIEELSAELREASPAITIIKER